MFAELLEKVIKVIEGLASEDTVLELGEMKLEEQNDILITFLNRKEGTTLFPDYWKPLPANRVIKIWNDYAKLGFVRDEKGIGQLSNKLIRLTVRLAAVSDLDPSDFDDDDIDESDFWDWAVDETGQYVISDYAWSNLWPLIMSLYEETDSEEKLQYMDRIFNVVHQRSDLSKFFIEGGRRTLDKLAYSTEYVDG